MPATTASAAHVAADFIGEAVTEFSNANAHLGVGDSTTAFNAAQTDLQAATNKLRKAMDSTYPQRSSATLTFRSTFASGEANWDWEEIALFNASSGGTMASRKVQDMGTKTAGAVWQVTYTTTISTV
jgi:hypothetical protein